MYLVWDTHSIAWVAHCISATEQISVSVAKAGGDGKKSGNHSVCKKGSKILKNTFSCCVFHKDTLLQLDQRFCFLKCLDFFLTLKDCKTIGLTLIYTKSFCILNTSGRNRTMHNDLEMNLQCPYRIHPGITEVHGWSATEADNVKMCSAQSYVHE